MKGFIFIFLCTICTVLLAQTDVKTIDPVAFQTKINSLKNEQLIDVRTPEEFASGHLQNAVNINFYSSDFKEQLEKLDKTKPVMVYCKSGGRSGKAAIILKELGFTIVYNLADGVEGWKNKQLPVVK